MDYSTMQSRVAEYLDRSDLTSKIQNWINDARKDIALKHDFDYLYTEATISTSAASATYSLPQDYMGHLTLMVNTRKLARVSGREFDELCGLDDENLTNDVMLFKHSTISTSGCPEYYIDRGMYIELYPVPDTTYTITMKYYYQPADFSADTDEDYMSRFHFECIIFGAALRGAVFLDDDVKIQIFTSSYAACVQEMIKREREKNARDIRPRIKGWKDFDLAQFKRHMRIKN